MRQPDESATHWHQRATEARSAAIEEIHRLEPGHTDPSTGYITIEGDLDEAHDRLIDADAEVALANEALMIEAHGTRAPRDDEIEQWWQRLPETVRQELQAHPDEPVPTNMIPAVVQAGEPVADTYRPSVGQNEPSGYRLGRDVQEWIANLV